MARFERYYLDKKSAEEIEEMVAGLAGGIQTTDPENFLNKLTAKLPIIKSDISSVRRRIEGFYFTTELLWREALRLHNGDRKEIIHLAKLKPLSHYHYLTGSREPQRNVMTRADYFNDPTTALVKLHDDIIGLVSVFPVLQKEAATT